MKTFVFDINKAVAAAAYLTKRRGGEISGFILLKMLYGGERRAILGWHRPITGDSFCSMPKGPVLSRIYDLIKGAVLTNQSDMEKWAKHFFPRDGYNVKLREDPDFDFLSDREKKALDESFEEIETLESQNRTIANRLHEMWPEWKDPKTTYGKGSFPIEVSEVLEQGFDDEDDVQRIVLEIQAVQSAKAALQTN